MSQHLRAGIAVALVGTSLFAAAFLTLNPRFVDDLSSGFALFLVLPVALGSVLGAVAGKWLARLAEIGSNEDPARAYVLLWAAFTGFLVFFTTLAVLPPYLGIFSSLELVRYGGAMALAGGLAWGAANVVRYAVTGARVWIWPVLIASPVVLVLAGGTEWGRGKAEGSRTLVIAVPGFSWDVAEELIEKGAMPHLAKLRKQGAWGTARSVPPVHAPVIWTSVATGKTCEEHGIMSFAATGEDIRVRRIWDILAERGWSIGLFGWPLTWPPSPVDGFVVPAVSDVGTETHPSELRFIRELAMSEKTGQRRTWGKYCRYAFLGIRYGARLSTLIDASMELLVDPLRGRNLDSAQLFNKRKLRARLNCDYFVELRRQKPVEFAAYFTNIVSVAQRFFWKYHEPSAFQGISPADIARYGTSVQDSYRLLDKFLGRILDDTGANELVVLVSDHGAVASTDGSPKSLTLRVEPVLKQMRLKTAMEATNVGARTYLRMKSGYEGNPDRVKRLFEAARLDRSNIRAFRARVDEWGNVVVTVNPAVNEFLDDTLLFQGGRCEVSDVIRAADFDESAQVSETGTLLLTGRNVPAGRRFEEASLLDLVPTLLVLNGLDLAADLGGDVIEDALAEDLRRSAPGVVATYETGTWDLVGGSR